METTFQTSFIPKQPITETRQSRSSGGSVSIFIFISIILLIASIVSAGLVYVYKVTLEKGVARSEEELARAKDAFDGDFIAELQAADKRLRAANDVVESHVVLSPIFEILQSSTLKTVRFTKFSHSIIGTGNTARVEVKMSGKARDYTAIALQSDALTKSKYIKDPLFSNLTLDEQSNVLFDLTFSVDPQLVLFTNVISKEGVGDQKTVDTLPKNKVEDVGSSSNN